MDKFKRNCPQCSCEIIYSTKYTKINADKNKNICRSCAATGKNNGMYGMVGDKNPFFNKNHSEETIEKLKTIDRSYTKTDEFKDKISKLNSGIHNSMYGKSVYSVWVDKYGTDIADEKMLVFKDKISKLNSGKNNPMYGKPSPKGSGNGWSGWYKGWFFRSLGELTYMVKVIERFNLKWESAETNKWKVKYYDYNDKERNYFSDFIVGDKYMVECKPKKLWNSDNVTRKRNSAIIFCNVNNLKYKMSDVGKLTHSEIVKLYDKGLIKFMDKYEIKFKEWKKKKLKN